MPEKKLLFCGKIFPLRRAELSNNEMGKLSRKFYTTTYLSSRLNKSFFNDHFPESLLFSQQPHLQLQLSAFVFISLFLEALFILCNGLWSKKIIKNTCMHVCAFVCTSVVIANSSGVGWRNILYHAILLLDALVWFSS